MSLIADQLHVSQLIILCVREIYKNKYERILVCVWYSRDRLRFLPYMH